MLVCVRFVARERLENMGCNIHLNTRERQLYKDGEVIDKWFLQGF